MASIYFVFVKKSLLKYNLRIASLLGKGCPNLILLFCHKELPVIYPSKKKGHLITNSPLTLFSKKIRQKPYFLFFNLVKGEEQTSLPSVFRPSASVRLSTCLRSIFATKTLSGHVSICSTSLRQVAPTTRFLLLCTYKKLAQTYDRSFCHPHVCRQRRKVTTQVTSISSPKP